MPKSSNLVPIKKMIHRGGKDFVTTVYVSPDQYQEHLKRNSNTSKQRHLDESGQYTPQRIKLHKSIISNVVNSCPKPSPGEQPTAILLLGGAASGKSTVVNKFIKPKNGVNFGTLNADDIKESIPEYKKFIHTDAMLAASRVHEESSDLAHATKDKIINEGRNFIFDAVLGNKTKAKELINTLKEKGYKIKLVGVNVNAKDALQRAKLRALGDGDKKGGSGRYVPDEILLQGHKGSAETFEEIKDMVDDYELYDNNVEYGADPIKVVDSHEVYNESLYNNFKEKKNINIHEIIQNEPSILHKALSKLRDIFSNHTPVVNEQDGNELTDLDISRINLNVKKSIIDDLLQQGEDLNKSYEENISELNELKKSEDIKPILSRIETKIDQTEQIYLENKYNQTQELRKAEADLYASIDEHCDLLKSLSPELIAVTGDFKYKKYLTNTLNRTRDTMPQIDSDKIDDVILHFQGKSPNAKVTKETIKLSDIKFSQNEINEDKVLSILETIDPTKLTRFLVSKDNRLIDGAHRFCALCEIDEEMEVECYKIHLDAKEAIRRLNIMKLTRNDDISKSELDESFELIKKAFDNDQISPEEYKIAKDQYDIIKARSGVYADNATNRRLKRVGQKYGEDKQDTQSGTKDTKSKPTTPDKVYSDKELQEHAKNASQQDLERQIKESNDPKIREHAHKELDRRSKEESVQEDDNKEGDKQKEQKGDFDISEKKYDTGTILIIGQENGSRVRGKISKDGKTFQIKSTFVEEVDRGKGMATKMYEQLFDELKNRGIYKVKSDEQVEELAGKIYQKFEKQGYSVTKHPDAVLEDDPTGNFWWVESDDSKSPFEIDLSNEVKKSEDLISLSNEYQISKAELIDIFLNNIDDEDVDKYLNRNKQADMTTESE